LNYKIVVININIDSLIDSLLYQEESNTIDFKSKQYKFENESADVKSEIIKDILGFSNAWRQSDAYILTGVKDVKGGRSLVFGIEQDIDDASLQQFINSKTQRPITFTYKKVSFEGKKIGLIHIPAQQRPIYLKKRYGKLEKEVVYIRRSSSTSIAKLDEVVKMGSSESYGVSQEQFFISFYDDQTDQLAQELECNITRLSVTDVPKYYSHQKPGIYYDPLRMADNNEYYEQLIEYFQFNLGFQQIKLAIENRSLQMIKNIEVELKIHDSKKQLEFFESRAAPDQPHKTMGLMNSMSSIGSLSDQLKKEWFKVSYINGFWKLELSKEHVLPGKTMHLEDHFFVGSKATGEFKFEVKLFGENIPSPITQELILNISREESNLTWEKFKEFEEI